MQPLMSAGKRFCRACDWIKKNGAIFTDLLQRAVVQKQGYHKISRLKPHCLYYRKVVLFLSKFTAISFCSFSSGTLHGIVLWMDFHLTDKLTVSTGLEQASNEN